MSWEIECKKLSEELKKHELATMAALINFDFQEKELHLYSYVGATSAFSRLPIESEEPAQFSVETAFMIKLLDGLKGDKALFEFKDGILKFRAKGSKGEITCTPWEGQEIHPLEEEEELSDTMKDALYDLTPQINLDKKSLPIDPGLRVRVKDKKLSVLVSSAYLTGSAYKDTDGEDKSEAEMLLEYCTKLSKLFDKTENISIRTNISTMQVSSENRTINFPLIKMANGMSIDALEKWKKGSLVDANKVTDFKIDCSALVDTLMEFEIYMPKDNTGKFSIKSGKNNIVVLEANSSRGKLVKPLNTKTEKEFECYLLYKDLMSVLKLLNGEISFEIYNGFAKVSKENVEFVLNGYAA